MKSIEILEIVRQNTHITTTQIAYLTGETEKSIDDLTSELSENHLINIDIAYSPSKSGAVKELSVTEDGRFYLRGKQNTLRAFSVQDEKCTIFISHSSADQAIGEKILLLIKDCFPQLTDKDIFFTSRADNSIPVAVNWRSHIRSKLRACEEFIAIISEDYKESEICNFEIGSAWTLEKPIYALIIKPLGFSTFSKIINENQAAIVDAAGINQLIAQLSHRLGIESKIQTDDLKKRCTNIARSRSKKKRDTKTKEIKSTVKNKKTNFSSFAILNKVNRRLIFCTTDGEQRISFPNIFTAYCRGVDVATVEIIDAENLNNDLLEIKTARWSEDILKAKRFRIEGTNSTYIMLDNILHLIPDLSTERAIFNLSTIKIQPTIIPENLAKGYSYGNQIRALDDHKIYGSLSHLEKIRIDNQL